MSGTSVDRYRHLFVYEKDAHAKTLASLEAVSGERRDEEPYRRCVELLAHLVAARRTWLFRFGVSGSRPATLFPKGGSLAEVASELAAMEAEWESFLDTLDEAGLERVFEYTALEGARFRNVVEDILTQLFGHSWYHLGQIAQLLRQMGETPAVTDYVFFMREAV